MWVKFNVCSVIPFTAAGVTRTAKWIVNCDSSGYLIGVTDNNGDTPAHDAAENKY